MKDDLNDPMNIFTIFVMFMAGVSIVLGTVLGVLLLVIEIVKG